MDAAMWSPHISLNADHRFRVLAFGLAVFLLVVAVFFISGALRRIRGGSSDSKEQKSVALNLLNFVYASFLKPHTGDEGSSQQDALESFYRAQAGAYDATRKQLLRGREEILALAAAQLKLRYQREGTQKCIWVDVGGGTGYNIEAMQKYLDVPSFFSSIYLVDFSPSLLEIAQKRFSRLGWSNVKVVCKDARTFRLEDYENADPVFVDGNLSSWQNPRADLVTLSYSLSMIPDYYSVVDSLSSLVSPTGIIGVVDFYVQSIVDIAGRNYIGGAYYRHVNWLGRVFWRAWFDVDRVGLEGARRDYLEYRFGTILSASSRNYLLCGIPYYMWIGCMRESSSTSKLPQIEASVTESPYLSAINHTKTLTKAVESTKTEIRSKAYDAAVVNLASNLPLPSFYYQNHHWRIHYDEQLRKHAQFNNEYIYAFTWEDVRIDQRILNINSSDVILAISSAGDNILAYALENPRRIHAVDLNPTQNHLLELKIAAFSSLPYRDVWKLFGEGIHQDFKRLLLEKLSPHLSSRAFQYWLSHTSTFTSKSLYATGGSRHAITLAKYLFFALGLSNDVRHLCNAKTLNEQREVWRHRIRGVLLNRFFSWLVIGNEQFLWKAFGVPTAQRNMIEKDFLERNPHKGGIFGGSGGRAIWEYVVDTLDPVVENSLIGDDNYFYLLCMQGRYSQSCHPSYLSPKAHAKLSRADAFAGMRIHTDEINEVLDRIAPSALTIAVVMDSMDWFTPPSSSSLATSQSSSTAANQIRALNLALAPNGRVLLRSAALNPWYLSLFSSLGFSAKCVNARAKGQCVDRVNMYASTWVCTKTRDFGAEPAKEAKTLMAPLRVLSLGKAAWGGEDGEESDASTVVDGVQLLR